MKNDKIDMKEVNLSEVEQAVFGTTSSNEGNKRSIFAKFEQSAAGFACRGLTGGISCNVIMTGGVACTSLIGGLGCATVVGGTGCVSLTDNFSLGLGCPGGILGSGC